MGLLDGLNEAQLQAVTAPATGQLQIVAGPGTGKTRVLAARVAYLLVHYKLPPASIIVTTFTKKAALEMRERITALLSLYPHINVSAILMGTFHSICFRLVRIYGKLCGLDKYTVADERDASQMLNDAMAATAKAESSPASPTAPNSPASKDSAANVRSVRRHISSLKSRGITLDRYAQQSDRIDYISRVYSAYQARLAASGRLDFDDCLLACLGLLSSHPVLNRIRHVLVDEFQDTNEIQLQLLYKFAEGNHEHPQSQHNVTVVGDPDQGIYAFRDALAGNFDSMRLHYGENCKVVALNHNYRLTKAIVDMAEAVMQQQQDRLKRSPEALAPASFKPVLSNCASASAEAKWIVRQVQALLALPGVPCPLSDMAVLVRLAYQTRAIEDEFRALQIPYTVVRGTAFWERKEVVAMLDYMRIVADPQDRDQLALKRCINFPKRGVGDSTWQLIAAQAQSDPETPLCDLLSQCAATLPKRAAGLVQKFVSLIQDSRKLLHQAAKPHNLKEWFTDLYVKLGLRDQYLHEKGADQNVQEVLSHLCSFEPVDEDLPLFLGGNASDQSADDRNIVAKFVQSLGLYEADAKKSEELGDAADLGKCALSTIHGSKGLEWPVVFVPGLCESVLPASFALGSGPDALDEERRCFYVAATRARALLYLSSHKGEMRWGGDCIDTVSRFVADLKQLKLVVAKPEALSTEQKCRDLYRLLDKELPPDFDFAAYLQATKPPARTRGKAKVPPGKEGFTRASSIQNLLAEHDTKRQRVFFNGAGNIAHRNAGQLTPRDSPEISPSTTPLEDSAGAFVGTTNSDTRAFSAPKPANASGIVMLDSDEDEGSVLPTRGKKFAPRAPHASAVVRPRVLTAPAYVPSRK